EVMCGSGRCGTFFAFEQDGIKPDIVTIAKGLGGGYQPISAMLARGVIHDSIVAEQGSFSHGHTYVGHATACAAALAVADVIVSNDLLPQVVQSGKSLRSELQSCFSAHPYVGDIRGRGLFVGIEIVDNRSSKSPADASLGNRISAAAMQRGLMVYPGGGTADGTNGAHILLAPPFIYERAHLDELVSKLKLAVGDALGEH
ncbi:MAG: aminotransferase class III-fold pyridoxal phosphate-dependent enzyme, partial [Gammaproteobacteria bacterium]|nr:aminotransferase class III-fold pyridoxal phosphate-dependent enzyme [Gammaproteobacteria bacterium]